MNHQSKLDDRLQRSRRYSSNGLRPLLCSVLEMDSESSTSRSARPRCDLTFAAGYASSSTQSGSVAPWSAMLAALSPRSMLSICARGTRNRSVDGGMQARSHELKLVGGGWPWADLRYRRPESSRPPEAERRGRGHPPDLHLVLLHVQPRVQQVTDVAAAKHRSCLSRQGSCYSFLCVTDELPEA